MSALAEAIDELRAIEEALQPYPALARRVHDVVTRLAEEDDQWIELQEAQVLLGVDWDETVVTWARLGLLRSRDHSGRVQVHRADVLRQREIDRALEGDRDDRPISAGEEHRLHSTRLIGLSAEQRVALEDIIAEARRLARA